mgnify:CR=1 FL=1
MEFHKITRVFNSSERVKYWADITGKSDRNVLFLSPCFFIMNWKDWIDNGGYGKRLEELNM